MRLVHAELVEMKYAKSVKAGNSGLRIKPSPFAGEIREAPLPKGFVTPKIPKFEGPGDPVEHINAYHEAMMMHGHNEFALCIAFSSTLAKRGLTWYGDLPPSSVANFQQLADMFCQHFVAGLKRKREAVYLITIKQGKNESLCAYIKRFNEAMLEVDELNCQARKAFDCSIF